MPKTKAQKQTIIQTLADLVERQKSMEFIDVKGMTVKELEAFRAQLRSVGAKLAIVKKTLFRKALIEKGIEHTLKDFEGQMAAVVGLEDPIAPIKQTSVFAKTNLKLKVLGGYFEKAFQSKESMLAIAQLPSKDEMLAILLRTISAPTSRIVNILNQNVKGLLIVLRAKSEHSK
ncbi:MAG: 50S ribosomal protein L10 [Candidatus Wildermuthbacteria bacterium]|nr:50S ribosomal protein L10 [Candidatus Wildermuthbacteria bacterium]